MMTRSHRNRCRGFTLIEMVVALVLAALMMVGLLRVVTWVSINTNQMQSEQTDFVSAATLADRLRHDLTNARGILADAGSLRLTGFVGPQHVSGAIQYERAIIRNRQVLIRRTAKRSELCWVGFGGFVFEPYDDVDTSETPPKTGGGLPPMPGRFRISALDTNGQVLLSEVIVHHAE